MVAHRHEAVEATGGIKCHTNHNQQAGTAQLDAHTGQVTQNDRQHSHRSQEDGTDEGDLVQGAGDEIAGRLAGTGRFFCIVLLKGGKCLCYIACVFDKH